MTLPRPWVGIWIVTTVVGYAAALGVATLVMGVPGRPLAGLLGGAIYLAVYGAIAGIVLSLVLLVALRGRGIVPATWVVATAGSLAIAFPLMASVGELLGDAIDPRFSLVIGEGTIQDVSGATLGLLLGLAQWLVLRRLGLGRTSWLVASALGAAIGYGVAAAALELFEIEILRANLVPSFGLIVGLFLGVAQAVSLALPRR